ncbi:metal-dependent transcriptional regulator [Halobacterium sp. R2-5]|uniref:metal-dependent transcriptional regulator n=1 Tax=Halobacterium sp. R2-5 TaxID=2715751 RepID=UPI00141FE95A|nr:metal-dependent transcriptional regulator [Halobacterium sp. R2-5]NIB99022.1 metal-dependent transcriptional regulator [Halobacterium sp. R2-5]
MLSDVMEDYLKAVYALEREHGPPVKTSAIADYLDVTPPTVTSMVEKLEERGLLAREKYKGVELTPEGETVALEVLRHHRLLEAFLADHLDYSFDEVHDEADALEHHISEEFERRLARKLDDPTVDPHGDPIPGADLEPPEHPETAALADHEAGDRVVVAQVDDRNSEELRYLRDAGIEPGTELAVREHAPIGLFVVDVDGDDVHLPDRVAAAIRVRAVDAPAGEVTRP